MSLIKLDYVVLHTQKQKQKKKKKKRNKTESIMAFQGHPVLPPNSSWLID